ncbi:ABC-type dipeptide transport system periplasmic component [Gaiella occulta]|uniref:ABC-type dipeptide transport system periplasmic component n=2 Tax=Gaiella occulta TaxID=1002870 RepID=A0A7M2Z0S5_9ACTN|nr:ABC-type dipeptide transport system periplasmic component [Gaiella occulta]
MSRPSTRVMAKVLLVLVVSLVATTAAFAAKSGTKAVPTLVVDKSFEIKTADPQRAFEPTASIVNRAVFDTLFTYKGSDVAHPVPLLVQSWKASSDAKTFTFQLRKDVRFADGTPLTSADVVFSLRRLVRLKGNPSFLLDGVTVSAAGKYRVLMRSANANSALPAILANTSLSIVNSKLVKKNGGTDAADADKTDKAEQWFNSPKSLGAGSGPYVLKQYSTSSQIVLAPNPKYWGQSKPAFSSVVVRNMIAPTQLINVQRGKYEVAIDLSAQQAQTIQGSKSLSVLTTPSTWVFFLFANNDPKVSGFASNKNFQRGVRYALDYKAIAGVAGPGAIQAPGIIPSMFLGALPQSSAVKQDLAKAKAAFAASGLADQKITLEFPSSLTINGVLFDSLAQKVQANLQAAGLNVELAGAPVGTWLQRYRDGKMPFGLSLWGPDYPDPSDYLAFLPGELVGLRAGWPAGSEKTVEALGATARVTTNDAARERLYQTIQKRLNAYGPFFPLLQPTQVFVATKDLATAKFNSVYSIDVTQTKPKG